MRFRFINNDLHYIESVKLLLLLNYMYSKSKGDL